MPRTVGRVILGLFLIFAGVSHLSFARDEFASQVPDWVPLSKDAVVLASGVVEVSLGGALLLLRQRRVTVGWVVAAFFVAVFPGNISQYLTHSNAFGLDSDQARGIRLLFQPLLVLWALWSTGAWRAWRTRSRTRTRTHG
ncbi:membrane protein [Glaciibacter psychrotolerans]